MKRIIGIIITVCLCLSFTGCKALDYNKANNYYKDGQYAEALEIFTSLGDYADSQAMAHLSWQKADYEAAGEAYAAGDYRQAMELYYGLQMYMDSPVKAVESQYALGLDLIEQGQYSEAIALLEELGVYSDSPYHVRRATSLQLQEALTQLGSASLKLDAAGDKTLSLVCTGDDTMVLTYTNQSLLLGLPNESSFALTFSPIAQTASYEASYLSAAARTILEESAGTVDLAAFGVNQGLSTESFTQTVTDPDGVVTVSNDTAEAIILQSLLSEATAVIAENFAAIMELTDTGLNPQDLGFTGLN